MYLYILWSSGRETFIPLHDSYNFVPPDEHKRLMTDWYRIGGPRAAPLLEPKTTPTDIHPGFLVNDRDLIDRDGFKVSINLSNVSLMKLVESKKPLDEIYRYNFDNPLEHPDIYENESN